PSQKTPARKAPVLVKTGGPAGRPAVAVPKRMRRVVVLLGSKPNIKELAMREAINTALKASKAPEGVMVLNVAFNEKGNAILTLRDGCEATQLLKFRDVVSKTFANLKAEVSSIEADQQWAKFKLHGISTEQFSGEEGMKKLRKKIETFNSNVRLVSEPRWLTKPESRFNKQFSSVVVAVNDMSRNLRPLDTLSVAPSALWFPNPSRGFAG